MDSSVTHAPLVTVLMPVYNAETFLRHAIDSVLNQTFSRFEFLIIDDASSDSSLEIIQSYKDPRIRIIEHTKNQKLIATLNEGIKSARTDLIARMDADDISVPSRLQKQYDFMQKHPDYCIVGTSMKVIDEHGAVIAEQEVLTDNVIMQQALDVINVFPHGSVMYRKTCLLQAGLYNPRAYLVEDYELWTRLRHQGKLANISETLYLWRRNPQGESLTKSALQRRNLQKVRDALWSKQASDYVVMLATIKPSRLIAELHVLFARALYRHNRRWLALQHLTRAIRIAPKSVLNYGYFLMFILPRSWFFTLEEYGFRMREKHRGW